MGRSEELERLERDVADDEGQELREQVAHEIPLRLSENALRLLVHHQVAGDQAGIGFATATEMAAALGDGAAVLFASERWYAAAGLVRQLIECQYLIHLMGNERSEAERWIQADHDEIVATFMPRHMRERASRRFRTTEYSVHSDWGSHPNPAGRGLLAHHRDLRPVPPRFLWVDLAQHLAELWSDFESALNLFDPRRDPGDPLYSPERSPDGGEDVAAALAKWRERDPAADRRAIEPTSSASAELSGTREEIDGSRHREAKYSSHARTLRCSHPMDEAWASQFQRRMRTFGAGHPHHGPGVSVSLKVRVTSGCFHREHSPNAYSLIDAHLASVPHEEARFDFLEHESGPEVLVYLAFGTAGLALAKSVIDLLVAIIAARREGVRRGDRPSDPIELIVRRVEHDDAIVEETVLRIGTRDPIDPEQVEAQLNAAIERLASEATEEGD